MNKVLFKVFTALLFLLCNLAVAVNTVLDGKESLNDVKENVGLLERRLDELETKSNLKIDRPNLFNPGITAFGNFVACAGQGYPEAANGLCDQPFMLRELELDLRASVDPWADAVFILAFEPAHQHSHATEPEPKHKHDHDHSYGHDHDHDHDHAHTHEQEHSDDHKHDEAGNHGASFQVEIEEAYITLKKWPLLDSSPLGIQLKIGRFRVPFGRANQIHLHDLPQSTMPLSMQAFLGEHGLIRNGISGSALIPTPGENNSMSLTLQILSSAGLPFSEANISKLPAGLAHWSWFWDLASNHDLEVGASAYVEPVKDAIFPRQVYGLDASYKWRPFVHGDKKSILVGGEFYAAPKEDDHTKKVNWGFGGFAFAQYQFNEQVYLGLRYDYRDAFTDKERGQSAGIFLTYYTTEFLRFRLGYEAIYTVATKEIKNNALLEVNFIFGSHPVEPYWVNR
ncbi:MAG: hypothetical protein O2897_01195 [bacterium]|nr:hypothetical protein [bacterium]